LNSSVKVKLDTEIFSETESFIQLPVFYKVSRIPSSIIFLIRLLMPLCIEINFSALNAITHYSAAIASTTTEEIDSFWEMNAVAKVTSSASIGMQIKGRIKCQ
jgi:hypothetical protein